MKPLSLRVVLADDHSAVRAGLQYVLTTAGTISVTGSARNSTELMDVLARSPCDVLISDYSMPGGRYGDGIALFKLVKKRYPSIKIVVLTMLENPGIVHSLLTLGISCILSKSDSLNHLMPAVHGAFANGRYLSPTITEIAGTVASGSSGVQTLTTRELEVIRFFVSGLTVNEIAERLSRSKKTISTQTGAAMLKLGLKRDVDLLRYGIESGLADAEAGPSIARAS